MINLQIPDDLINEVHNSRSSNTLSTVTSSDDLHMSSDETTRTNSNLSLNIRKDAYGKEIKKGGNYKVTFIDKIRNTNSNGKTLFKGSLKEIILIESYKKYNVIKNEDDEAIVDEFEKDDGTSGKSCLMF